MILSIIAALAEGHRGIGLKGRMPWRLPADLARFRRLTMGHTLIMGRTTFASLQGRSLPGRRIIVLTRGLKEDPADPTVETAASLDAALERAEHAHADSEVFLAGGSRLYAEALERDLVDRMYLTIVHAEVEADTFFPPFDEARWAVVQSEARPADGDNPYPLTFQLLDRQRVGEDLAS